MRLRRQQLSAALGYRAPSMARTIFDLCPCSRLLPAPPPAGQNLLPTPRATSQRVPVPGLHVNTSAGTRLETSTLRLVVLILLRLWTRRGHTTPCCCHHWLRAQVSVRTLTSPPARRTHHFISVGLGSLTCEARYTRVYLGTGTQEALSRGHSHRTLTPGVPTDRSPSSSVSTHVPRRQPPRPAASSSTV